MLYMQGLQEQPVERQAHESSESIFPAKNIRQVLLLPGFSFYGMLIWTLSDTECCQAYMHKMKCKYTARALLICREPRGWRVRQKQEKRSMRKADNYVLRLRSIIEGTRIPCHLQNTGKNFISL